MASNKEAKNFCYGMAAGAVLTLLTIQVIVCMNNGRRHCNESAYASKRNTQVNSIKPN